MKGAGGRASLSPPGRPRESKGAAARPPARPLLKRAPFPAPHDAGDHAGARGERRFARASCDSSRGQG